MIKYILLLSVAGGLWLSSVATAQPVLPETLSAVPVLISMSRENGDRPCGTGVFLNHSNQAFLVTAAHVLFNMESTNQLLNNFFKLEFLHPGWSSQIRNTMDVDVFCLQQDGRVKRHPTHDIAVVQFGFRVDHRATNNSPGTGLRFYNGVNPAGLSSKPGMSMHTTEICTAFADISDGSDTYLLGYPAELLNDNPLGREVDFRHPLIRRGIISQKNRVNGKLIIDSGVYGGNSGGPVFICQKPTLDQIHFRLVGFVTQFVPALTRVEPRVGVTNSVMVYSGYAVAEPIDYALELMRQF